LIFYDDEARSKKQEARSKKQENCGLLLFIVSPPLLFLSEGNNDDSNAAGCGVSFFEGR
jgi:hypothetical protein